MTPRGSLWAPWMVLGVFFGIGSLWIPSALSAETLEANLPSLLEETQQGLTNLQEQLRIAQRTQAEQVNEIRLLRAEVARLTERTSALSLELETARGMAAEARQLQAERAELQGRLNTLQASLEKIQREARDKEQGFVIEGRAAKAHVERLQQELESAKTAQLKAEQELDRLQRASTEGLPPALPSPVEKPPTAPPLTEGTSAPSPATRASTTSPQVLIHRISESRDFMVISLQRLPGVKEGSTLLLSQGDQPVAEVELSNLDDSGMAMAFVTRPLQDLSGVEAGNTLSARILMRTSSATISPEEP